MEDSPPPFISAAPIDDDDLFTWHAILSGVPGTPLEGTAVVVELTFPTDFPKNAPTPASAPPSHIRWAARGTTRRASKSCA